MPRIIPDLGVRSPRDTVRQRAREYDRNPGQHGAQDKHPLQIRPLSTARSGAATSRPKKRGPVVGQAVERDRVKEVAPRHLVGDDRLDPRLHRRAAKPPPTNAAAARCHSSSEPVRADTAMPTATTVFTTVDIHTRVRRSTRSANSPPMGETTRKGMSAEKVMIPTQPEPSERSCAIHEAATMNAHMPPKENMPVSHMLRKSADDLSEAKWGKAATLPMAAEALFSTACRPPLRARAR